MWFDQHVVISHFAATLPQIANQLLAGLQLHGGRLAVIKIADQTDAERDIVQIIAVHMSAVDLAPPAIADFDLAVARGGAIPDDEMIGQPILHVTHMPMIIIEDPCVPLPRAAVMHDDELPRWIAAIRRRAIDFRAHRAGQITITRAAPASSAARAIAMEEAIPKAGLLLGTGLLDG